MKPGKDLDTLIAQNVFKLDVHRTGWDWTIGPRELWDNQGSLELLNPLPNYSTNIADAWTIVDEMRGVWDLQSMSNRWFVRLAVQDGNSDKIMSAEAYTVEYAICLAALMSLGVKLKE
jgi:hypothetical protein